MVRTRRAFTYVKPISLSICRVPTPSTRRGIFMGKCDGRRAIWILVLELCSRRRALEPAVRAGIERTKFQDFCEPYRRMEFALHILEGVYGWKVGQAPLWSARLNTYLSLIINSPISFSTFSPESNNISLPVSISVQNMSSS